MHKGRILLSFLTASALLLILLSYSHHLFFDTPKTAEASTRYSITIARPTIVIPTISVKKPVVFIRSANIPTPTPTKKPTPTPTTSIPTATPTPTHTPTPTTQPTNTNSVSDYILEQVNNYRKSQGLSPVTSNSETCSFAAIRAQEISTNFSHDGFTSRVNSKTIPYPSYHDITENIAMNSNYKNVINQWINSPGHAENMRRDTPYACIMQSGNYYAYEGWRP